MRSTTQARLKECLRALEAPARDKRTDAAILVELRAIHRLLEQDARAGLPDVAR